MSKRLLIVEDDPGLQTQLRWCFSADYEVLVASDRASALEKLAQYNPPVVTLDLGLPPDAANASEGLSLLEQILAQAPQTKVIVITGNDERDFAIRAIGAGAHDFYHKPIDPEIIRFVVARAFRIAELESENQKLKANRAAQSIDGIVVGSQEMMNVWRNIEKVAPTNATVLLLGESGTGKELLARALQQLSTRRDQRFVAINCAAIPENLLESELFGYEKGAFTGASKQTEGKIELADGGTLFLDEIGDLPLTLQAKLLRFLQERVIERLGGRQEIPVDVRIICATHKDLNQLSATGEFRSDLFFRISGITIKIPPLRDRVGEVLVLARAFLQRFAREHGRPIKDFNKEALQAIERYSWPGNARELENRVRRAVIMAETRWITPQDLELPEGEVDVGSLNLRELRENLERTTVSKALLRSGGKIVLAAELMGITRPTLYDLMNRYGLRPLGTSSTNPIPSSAE
jgi:two-component system NtrC family response regulator